MGTETCDLDSLKVLRRLFPVVRQVETRGRARDTRDGDVVLVAVRNVDLVVMTRTLHHG